MSDSTDSLNIKKRIEDALWKTFLEEPIKKSIWGIVGLFISVLVFFWFNPSWWSAFALGCSVTILLVLVILIIIFIKNYNSLATHTLNASKSSNLSILPISDEKDKAIELLEKTYQEQIEGWKQTLSQDREKFREKVNKINEDHKEEKENMERMLGEVEANLLSNKWLSLKAQKQKEDIDNYIMLEKFFWNRIESSEIPHLVFTFQLANKSLFMVTLDNNISGYIEFRGKVLDGGKRFYHNPDFIDSFSYKWFNFEYRVSREELEFILNKNEIQENDFDVSKLIFTIKGADSSYDIRTQKLRIERFCKVWNYQEYERATSKWTGIVGKI